MALIGQEGGWQLGPIEVKIENNVNPDGTPILPEPEVEGKNPEKVEKENKDDGDFNDPDKPVQA